jgi:hypothetical protein
MPDQAMGVAMTSIPVQAALQLRGASRWLAVWFLLVAAMAASPAPAMAQVFAGLGNSGGQNQNAPQVDKCPASGTLSPQGLLQGGPKGTPNTSDLLIDGTTCKVNRGASYYFGTVNIMNGGKLIFQEPTAKNSQVNFWAGSIIVENGGTLQAGTPEIPYGSNGGTLTIYIYGSDQSKGMNPATNPGQGTLCKTPEFDKTGKVRIAGPCGIPLQTWNDNGTNLLSMPHADKVAAFSDRFYQYGPLFGDGLCSDTKTVWNPTTFCGTNQVGYFGNKVFAVSYGGALQLFGYKGTPLPKGTTTTRSRGGGFQGFFGSNQASSGTGAATTGNSSSPLDLFRNPKNGEKNGGGSGGGLGGGNPGSTGPAPCAQGDPDSNPLSTGCSWLRLANDLSGTTTNQGKTTPGETGLTLSAGVGDNGDKWWNGAETGDQIVLTTTDYLPGHSELLTIKSVKGTAVTFAENVAWAHRGTKFPIASRLDPKDPNKPVRTRYIASGMDSNLIDGGLQTQAAVALLTRSIRIVSAGDQAGQTFEQASSNPDNCKKYAVVQPAKDSCYYYGAQMVIRQGFKQVQIQGVEFQYMGQGGKMGHYPIHFHLARRVPADTFIKDSVINESMTRWIVLHSTQGVLLQRNIGWKSIGHGFYLEDGTETDNKFYSNLGIFARAAVDNIQNPRKVPGILADSQSIAQPPEFTAPNVPNPGFPFRTDGEFPTAFWIANGWNDFVGNMAAGTGACGSGYWFVPTVNNDMPDVPTAANTDHAETAPSKFFDHMLWTTANATKDTPNPSYGYAGLQRITNFEATTPLRVFYGNSSTATMMSFQTTTDVPPCDGFLPAGAATYPPPGKGPVVLEIPSFAPPPARIDVGIPSHREADLLAGGYYPRTHGLRAATLCDGSTPDCSTLPKKCSDADESHCTVTVLDHFTSSFTWAHANVSALWLRPQWYLVTNSAITDVQNGGITFITGGDFTHSAVIPGYWAVMLNTVLVGHTQLQDSAHKFSLDSSPVNALSGLQCKPTGNGEVIPAYCVVADEGVSFPGGNFFVSQKLSNIYDGPSYQDSNIYLDITPTKCTVDSYNGPGGCIHGSGVNLGVLRDQVDQSCYLPNAAIGWKQPNGFFYPPAFHSTNLFFDNVGIRHYVIDPIFKASAGLDPSLDFGQGGTYITDDAKVAALYCTQNNAMFNGYTAIDRQTELNDDDATLTGLSNVQPDGTSLPAALKQTISVNEDGFFTAPVETPECASNGGNNLLSAANVLPANACKPPTKKASPVTAKTSPYDYVATAVFHPLAADWDSVCSFPQCYGVPLYRQELAGDPDANTNGHPNATREWVHWYKNGCGDPNNLSTPQCRWPFIRMAGEDTLGTRETLTVNNGIYYLDTAVPVDMQKDIHDKGDPSKIISRGENYNQQGGPTASIDSQGNVFKSGETYYVFFLYAKRTTRQTYQIYIGKDTATNGSIKAVRVQIPNTTLVPVAYSGPSFLDPSDIDTTKVASNGIVSVTVHFDKVTELDPTPANGLCQPAKFCAAANSNTTCTGALDSSSPAVTISPKLTTTLANDAKRACSIWAVKDLDCPPAGCLGFSFTLTGAFTADATVASPTPHRLPPGAFPNTNTNQGVPNWRVKFAGSTLAPDNASGGQCNYPTLPSYPPTGTNECATPDWVAGP